jgi:selenocysteine lyase/cysteine desulfurase
MSTLDIDFVRNQFPAFSEPSLQGQAFFENAGGSYACGQVIDRLDRYYRARKVQPYAPYTASEAAGAEMDEARARLAAMLNVGTDELHFGPSTSQNTYVLACAFAERLASGDVVIVTDQDHEANSGVWRRLANRGVEIREWRVDPASGWLDPAGLAELLDEDVALVCFPHCSNIVGQENPVAELCRMAHEVSAVTCVDAVSLAPHGFPDVRALDTDIYLFSSYKTYGPHQGIMVMSPEMNQWLPNQGHWFNADSPTKRFAPAGPDHAQIAASAGIADYIDTVYAHHHDDEAGPAERAAAVRRLQMEHERGLLEPLLDYLRTRDDLRLIGPDRPAGRVPTVALHLERTGIEVAAELAGHGIMAGGGDFYAVRLLNALGIDPDHGVLRLSFVHYTHPEEIDRVIAALDAVSR